MAGFTHLGKCSSATRKSEEISGLTVGRLNAHLGHPSISGLGMRWDVTGSESMEVYSSLIPHRRAIFRGRSDLLARGSEAILNATAGHFETWVKTNLRLERTVSQ